MQEGEVVVQELLVQVPQVILEAQRNVTITYTSREFNGLSTTVTYNMVVNPTAQVAPYDEIILAQGEGGQNQVRVRNFDPEVGLQNTILTQFNYSSSNSTFRASVGGGAGRANHIAVGDVDNDGDLDFVDSFGPVTEEGAAFPNIFIPRDPVSKLPIGHSRNAFRASQYANGELTVAIGDFKEDGVNLIAVAQGEGSSNSLVRLFQYTGLPAPNAWAIVGQFQPLDNVPTANNANGGVTLDAGDIDGDGLDELVVGQTNSETSLTQFTVLDIDSTGNLPTRRNFVAFPAGLRGQGGVQLAVVDLNGDSINELVGASGGNIGTGELGSLLVVVRPNIVENSLQSYSRPGSSVIQVVGDDSGINSGGGLDIAAGDFDGDPFNGQEILYSGSNGTSQSFYRIVRIEYDPNEGDNGRRTGNSFLIGPPQNINFQINAYSGVFNPTSGNVDVAAGNISGN
jgi:hypothetical protein